MEYLNLREKDNTRMSQRIEPDVKGASVDENTMIADHWLELLAARENQSPPEPASEWGTLPSRALELTRKVESLRTRQDKLKQELDRIIDGLAAAQSTGVTEAAPPVPRPDPGAGLFSHTLVEPSGSGSFLKGIARKLFSGKTIR
jgi:hypothetical protein